MNIDPSKAGRVRILRSADLLREQAQRRDFPARVAHFVRAQVGNARTLRAQLIDRIDAAIESTASMVARAVNGAKEDEQRWIKIFHADSLKLSALEVSSIVRDGRRSSAVALAAAEMRRLPEAVQRTLVDHCQHHPRAMLALVLNANARPGVLLPLVKHPDQDVRRALSWVAGLGARLQIVDEHIKAEKQTLYNAMVEAYEPSFAPGLVPDCRDADQLLYMFAKTPVSESTLRLFVANPYSPPELLEAVVEQTERHPRFDPEVGDRARIQLQKRREQDSSLTLTEP